MQEVAEAVKDADLVMILMPDELQSATYKSEIENNINEGAVLLLLMDSIFISI